MQFRLSVVGLQPIIFALTYKKITLSENQLALFDSELSGLYEFTYQRNMYKYTAYGLNIHSDIPLPELSVCAENRADITIQTEKFKFSSPGKDNTDYFFQMNTDEAYFFWKEIGAFLAKKGNQILFDPLPGVEQDLIRYPLLGIVLATVIYQKNLSVLHANAVALNGKAVAFMGDRGFGKSTLAASFYAKGHPIVSDDLVVFDLSNKAIPTVFPGFPRLKLMPDVVSAVIGIDPDKIPKLASIVDKCNCPVKRNFSLKPIPLKCIYIIASGSVPELELLKPREALIHIMRNTSLTFIFNEYLNNTGKEKYFLKCSDIVERVPVYLLKRPPSLSLLPEIISLIERHSLN